MKNPFINPTPSVVSEKAITRSILHSTKSHGSYYLFDLIDSAVWLLCEDPSLHEVEIVLHPVGGFYTPQTIFKGLKQLIQRFFRPPNVLYGALRRRLGYLNEAQPYVEKLKAGTKEAFVGKTEAIFAQVYRGTHPVILKTQIGEIIIHRSGRRLISSLMDGALTYLTARRLWQSCHEKGILQAQRLLHLEYRGVIIGDLLASTALRQYPQAGGSLHSCPGLWSMLLNAVAICDYIAINIPNDSKNLYVTIPEPTYLNSIYSRLLHKNGACVLTRHHYAKDFVLISSLEELYNPKVVQTKKIAPLSDEDIFRANNYLRERVELPNKHLWYMIQGVNCTDDQLLDLKGNLIEIKEVGLCAVVFLHAFDDAQYGLGVDGFDDLYHWTIFTIDQLIDNPNVTKIYIKPHPNTDFIRYKGDKVAFKRLCDRYDGCKKINWLQRDCSLKAIAKLGRVVGVTHHGSVAEELTYLGIPVIGTTFARWGTVFSFVHLWRSPSEYEKLLKSLSYENWVAPSTEMIDNLLGYVLEYRLNISSPGSRQTWIRFGQWADGVTPKLDAETFGYHCRRLARLSPDDAMTAGFIEWLISDRIAVKSNNYLKSDSE